MARSHGSTVPCPGASYMDMAEQAHGSTRMYKLSEKVNLKVPDERKEINSAI